MGRPQTARRRLAGGVGGRRLLYGVTAPQSAILLRGQLRWFRERGWDVHLVTSPGQFASQVAHHEQITLHTIPMDRDPSPRADLTALKRWGTLLARLHPDVLNIASPKAGLLGSIAGWMTRVPVRVYVMWGLRLEGARSRRELIVLWLVERLTILLATDVICVSESLRREATARKLFGRRARPMVIGQGSSNGVNADLWDPDLQAVDRDEVRASWHARPEELVVGFVGRIAFDKGVQDLLAASRSLDDVPFRLVLAGPVEDDALRVAIAALCDRVTHLDEWVADLHRVYAGIDVLCLPTRREGFPNVVLEAALAEVPSITTDATGARDSVIPGVTGWVVGVGDATQIARAIRACAEDRPALRRAGRAARERVLRDFRPEAVWAGVEAVYLTGSTGSARTERASSVAGCSAHPTAARSDGPARV